MNTVLETTHKAYTTTRQDVALLVPLTARKILDVGCSNGALGSYLKESEPDRFVFGIEINHELATVAQTRLDYVAVGDIGVLNWSEIFGNYVFDCIIFADVLEHIENPDACMEALLPYLASGGCMIVSTPNIRHISAFWDIFVKGHFPRRERGIFDKTHLRWFTIADTVKMLRNQGLIVSGQNQSMRFGDKGGGGY